jgi:ABC-2 type transport system permease protein
VTAAWAVTKVQLRILRSDPWFLLIMFLMPLAIMPLFLKTMGLSLNSSGYANATGAEQVVPGQAVVFGFFVAGSMGFSVFREHGWHTWNRLRASAAGPKSLLLGFAAPWILIHIVYQALLIVAGSLFTGFDLKVLYLVDLLVLGAYSVAVIMFVLFAVSVLSSVHQVSAVVNLGAMVLGGLGGALVPLDQLPGWAQAIAPFTPTYWAMQGHNAVFLEGEGLSGVIKPVAIMLGIGVAFAFLGINRFRSDDVKNFFA